MSRTRTKSPIRVQPRENLIVSTPLEWCYRLLPEGFEVSISYAIGDKTIKSSNVMAWDDFIEGLALGWQRYHQDNPRFTTKLLEFVEQQIANGNYTPKSPGQASR